MKSLIALPVALFLIASFVQAAPRGPGNHYDGVIATVGTQGFAITTDDGKTLDVLCNANTKFMSGKDPAAPSDIKEGVRVSVQGGISGGTEVIANVVVIVPSKKKN
jgi:hypothetical protein